MTAFRAAATELAALHANRPDPSSSLVRACRRELSHAGSVGLTLAADAALAQRVSLAAAGPLAVRGEALQINLGEGPCAEALRRGQAVLAPDLHDPDHTGDWPVYAQQARAHGIRAAFAFPVAHPPEADPRPGLVLSVYRDRRGALSDADLATARTHVHAAELLLLSVPVPGEDDVTDGWLLPAEAVVHQATGMISYRHAVTAGQALALLRAHAHARQTDLADLAHAVVHHGLHLPAPPPTNP
ncbi:GAF and ANTAR domain-containing protein [Streptomyces sp. NPDC023327]|uniref:GAF and ANTAR domain-containing protein n=1 Tax=Streptomyces sp. NPDC023327 TaxID=3157088 RepID=UPI0034005EAC